MGDALSKKADVVITTGPIQSNHARATAAAARKLGLRVILVLTGKEPESFDGNLLLDHLLGAEIRFFQGKRESWEKMRPMDKIAKELAKKGHTPYVIPGGASYPVGASAYANAMVELLTQADSMGLKVNYVIHAAGSGGTQAGLILACKALKSRIGIMGIGVEPDDGRLAHKTVEIANGAARLLGIKVNVDPSDVTVIKDYVGEGYGILTSEALDAIRLVAQTEGILLDPVYTGKAMAGLIDMIRQKKFEKDDNVIFIHTGGTPALFPYKKQLS